MAWSASWLEDAAGESVEGPLVDPSPVGYPPSEDTAGKPAIGEKERVSDVSERASF